MIQGIDSYQGTHPETNSEFTPENGWFMMENSIKMDDFGGTTIFGNIHMYTINIVKVRIDPYRTRTPNGLPSSTTMRTEGQGHGVEKS